MVNEEANSDISKQKNTITIESDISEVLGSYPQNFASYQNNTFFAEHLLEDRKIDKKNLNFVKEEMNFEENLFVFKRVLQMIERHMNEKSCILSFLREIYLDYLQSKYHINSKNYKNSKNDKNDKNSKSSKNENSKVFEKKILKDIDCFIRIYKEIIMDFYNISKNVFLMNNANLRDFFSNEALRYFIINSLFNNEDFYDIAFEVEKAKNHKEESEFQNSLEKLGNLSLKIEDFGVSSEFLLKESPLEQEKNYMDLSSFNYVLALDCVKNLQFIKSPVHKLKSIILCGLMIKKSIEDFYFKIHKKIANDVIRPREFIRIMFFAVYKSKISCMITHYNMIKEFLHKDVIENLRLPFFRYFRYSVEFFVMANQISPEKNIFRNFLQEFLEEKDFA